MVCYHPVLWTFYYIEVYYVRLYGWNFIEHFSNQAFYCSTAREGEILRENVTGDFRSIIFSLLVIDLGKKRHFSHNFFHVSI